jgi:hypothetical protein
MSSVSGSGAFNIKFYANFIATAFDSKTSVMDTDMLPRPVAPRGPVETLQIEISNTGTESDTKQFDVEAIFTGLQVLTRTGVR